jgi:hypothetical protein
MIFKGVVARVSRLEGRKIVGEDLRFIPLMRGAELLMAGDMRLRITGARKGEANPELQERDLRVFAGRTIAAEATEFDECWLYGCVDISQNQT